MLLTCKTTNTWFKVPPIKVAKCAGSWDPRCHKGFALGRKFLGFSSAWRVAFYKLTIQDIWMDGKQNKLIFLQLIIVMTQKGF